MPIDARRATPARRLSIMHPLATLLGMMREPRSRAARGAFPVRDNSTVRKLTRRVCRRCPTRHPPPGMRPRRGEREVNRSPISCQYEPRRRPRIHRRELPLTHFSRAPEARFFAPKKAVQDQNGSALFLAARGLEKPNHVAECAGIRAQCQSPCQPWPPSLRTTRRPRNRATRYWPAASRPRTARSTREPVRR